MSEDDTPLKTVASMKKTLKKSGLPYVVKY